MPGCNPLEKEEGKITLPHHMNVATKCALEAAGVRFLKEEDRYGLYQTVELPAGWSIWSCDHPGTGGFGMGEIRDQHDRVRGFFQPLPCLRARKRIYPDWENDSQRPSNHRIVVRRCGANDDDEIIYATEFVEPDVQLEEGLVKQAEAWLKEHYPNYEIPRPIGIDLPDPTDV